MQLLAALVIATVNARVAGPVTYRSPGSAVSAVVAELSRTTGVRLEASPETAREVLAIRMAAVPFQEALAQIANAVDGTWKPEGEGYRLVRTPEQAEAEREAELRRDTAGYEAALGRIRRSAKRHKTLTPAEVESVIVRFAAAAKRMSGDKSTDRDFEALSDYHEIIPARGALNAIAASFSAREMALLDRDAKIVYSSQSNRMQRPLSPSQNTLVASAARQHAVVAALADRHRVELPNGDSVTISSDNEGPINRTAPVEKALVCVYPTPMERSITLDLSFFDGKKRLVSKATEKLVPEHPPAVPLQELIRRVPAEETVPMPPFLLAVKSPFAFGRQLGPEIDRFRAVLLSPEQTDPLSLGVGEALIRVAEVRKVNLVASLADESLTTLAGGGKTLKIVHLLQVLSGTYDIGEKAGWLTLKPWRPVANRRHRGDRAAMGQLLRRVAQGPAITIEEQGDFANRVPLFVENPIVFELAGLLRNPVQNLQSDWRTLRLYGRLTPSQRQQARAGGIPFASMTPAQLAVLNAMVFGSEPIMLSEDGPEGEIEFPFDSVYEEATEILPNGLSSQGVLRITQTQHEVVETEPVRVGETVYQGQVFAPEQLGAARFMATQPRPSMNGPSDGPVPNVQSVRLGVQRDYQFDFRFTPKISLARPIPGAREFAGTFGPYEKLPDAFKRRADRAFRMHQRMNSAGMGGRPTAPPPMP